jgi:hypothetical protein
MLVETLLNPPEPTEALKKALNRVAPPAPTDPTNHHNALTCPHCNPNGLTFAEAAPPAPTAEPLSHAHRWTLERLRDKLKAEEFGHQDFPLIQALEAAIAVPPERVSEGKEP